MTFLFTNNCNYINIERKLVCMQPIQQQSVSVNTLMMLNNCECAENAQVYYPAHPSDDRFQLYAFWLYCH